MSAGPRIRCLHCGDEIRSEYRHDFKYCQCKKIAVDGGDAYLRTIGTPGKDWELADPPDPNKEMGVILSRETK